MAGEKNIAGDLGNLSVFDGAAYKPVVCLTSSSLSSTLEMLEKVNMCNPGKRVNSPGTLTQSVQIEGEVIDTTDVGGDPAKVSYDELLEKQMLYPTTKTPDKWRLSRGPLGYKYFEGYISGLDDSWQAGSDATFSATLTVEGTVSDTEPA